MERGVGAGFGHAGEHGHASACDADRVAHHAAFLFGGEGLVLPQRAAHDEPLHARVEESLQMQGLCRLIKSLILAELRGDGGEDAGPRFGVGG